MTKTKTKFAATGLGFVLLTVIANNISEYTNKIRIIGSIVNFLKWIYLQLKAILNQQLSIWIIGIAILFIWSVKSFVKNLQRKEVEKPKYYDFNSAIFERWFWKWQWEYKNEKWAIINLTPYCGDCDVELSDSGDFMTYARCPKCKKEFSNSLHNYESKKDTMKLIDAKIRKEF